MKENEETKDVQIEKEDLRCSTRKTSYILSSPNSDTRGT